MGYIGQAPGLGIKRDFLFISTAGQTSFSGVDANGMTLLFDPRTVIVYVNGIRVLKGIDYTVPNVSTIIFTIALDLNDEVAVDNFEAFSPANTYTRDEADTLLAKKVSVDLPDSFTEAEQGQARANIGADVLGGYRNKIINGDFDVWQRATSLAAGVGTRYAADRWQIYASGSTIATSRQAFTLGQTDVPGNPTYFHRSVVVSSAGSSNSALMAHAIENVRLLSNKKITLTFWAKADSAKNIALEFLQTFGVSGSPSPVVNTIGTQLVALTTSWQKITRVVTMPSITGKTLGTNDNSSSLVYFYFDAGSAFNTRASNLGQQSGTFDIAHVSIVEGDATAEADPFTPRHIQQELALCYRYYWQGSQTVGGGNYANPSGFGYAHFQGSVLGTNYDHHAHVWFPVPMRTIPAITRLDLGSTSFNSAAQHANQTEFGYMESRRSTNSGNLAFCTAVKADAEL